MLPFKGNIEIVIKEFKRQIKKDSIIGKQEIRVCELTYFKNNKKRMDYSSYKETGLPIGSAVIESGIKQLVNNRLKGIEKH